MQLVSAEYVRNLKQLTANVQDARLDMFINEAQDLDIKPFLGEIFYYQMQTILSDYYAQPEPRPDPTTEQQNFINLYQGVTYVNQQGFTIIYEGLKPTVGLFSFSRFVQWDSTRYTRTGSVVKNHEQSDILSEKAIARNTDQARSEANAHANEVQRYLRNMHASFPNYWFNLRNKQARQPGPRISGIDKNSYNYPGAYNTNLPPNWFLTDNYW